MGKVILVFITIGTLALSAAQTYARPGQANTAATTAASSAARALLGKVERVPSPAAESARGLGLQESSPESDGPAPALLIYLGCILIGSAVGVGLVRRSQHGL